MSLATQISSLTSYLSAIDADVQSARQTLAGAYGVDWQSASADTYRGLLMTARADLLSVASAVDAVGTSLTNASA